MKELKEPIFQFYADCQLVFGQNGCAIFDTSRNKCFAISENIASKLNWCIGKSKSDIIEELSEDFDIVIQELHSKEIIFFTDIPHCFTKLIWEIDTSALITTSVIEISNKMEYDTIEVLSELDRLGCKNLLISFDSDYKKDFSEIEKIIATTFDSFVTNLELILPVRYIDYFDDQFLYRHRRIVGVIFIGSDQNSIEETKSNTQIICLSDIKINWTEFYSIPYFDINHNVFAEGKSRNLGLNNKVCISSNGDIKNYVNHRHSYGNVNEISIVEVVTTDEFQNKWFISNDLIKGCKDCKFRYVCVSNSDIYKENDHWYKKQICSSILSDS